MFVWTALDAATQANGCVKVVPGSHRHGLFSQRGHTLSNDSLQMIRADENAVDVEVAAGESILMHNWLVHSSGNNPTGDSRLAFSANYVDARTRMLDPVPIIQPENVESPASKPGWTPEVLFGGHRSEF